MKKLLVLLILLSGLIIPLACSDNNNNPTKASGPGLTGVASTPTVVSGPAGTPTNTPVLGPAPVFQHNYGTVGAPTGLVISGTNLTVSEYEVKNTGTVAMVEDFTIAAGGTLNPPGETNYLLQGFPTPNSTPAWIPQTVVLNGPQGFTNPGGFGGQASVLDAQSNGSAILYYGSSGLPGWGAPYNYGFFYEPYSTNSYGGAAFNNPKALTIDSNGYSYVADTGNGAVEEFTGAVPYHRWFGTAGVTFGSFVSVAFKSPYAITTDTADNVWVGDTGYSPSVIEEYASGGTTILGAWPTLPGCIVHGLAVNSGTGDIYVADSGNKLVEVYTPTGSLVTEFGDPGPAAHEATPFSPSCIGFSGNYIFVGDAGTGNDFVDVFQ
ncbi:MAG TPA: hypothetical protein VK859_01785 [bacterium]|jgi:hypothetical protein|nr:hypothetical protein [bacterium]